MAAKFKENNNPSYLIVLPWTLSNKGGVNCVVNNLLEELKNNNDYKPMLMSLNWANKKPVTRAKNGVVTTDFRLRSSGKTVYSFLAFFFTIPLMLYRLRRLLQQHHVDVINCHYLTHELFPLFLLKKLRLFKGKIILSLHGTDVENLGAEFKDSYELRFILRHATKITTCSRALADRLKLTTGNLYQNKIVAITNGIDPTAFQKKQMQNEALMQPLKNKSYILSIATYAPYKGLETLIKAFQALKSSNPSLQLVLVGLETPHLHQLITLTKNLDVEDSVHFYKDIDQTNLGAFYQNAKIFVLPSLREAFGLVILEAGLYKCPVIASNTGGIPEIISDEKEGLLFEPGNKQELTDKLEKLIQDKELQTQLGNSLHTKTIRDFNLTKVYSKYTAL